MSKVAAVQLFIKHGVQCMLRRWCRTQGRVATKL